MELNEWINDIHKTAKDKEWWDAPDDIKDDLVIVYRGIGRPLTSKELGATREAYKRIFERLTRRNTAELLMLIVTELAEACESDRKGNYGYKKKDTFEDEVADSVIRIFDMCGGLGIDLEKQMKWKHKFNKGREKRHGKKY